MISSNTKSFPQIYFLKFLPFEWITRIDFGFSCCIRKGWENDCFLKFFTAILHMFDCMWRKCLLAVGYRMIYVQTSFQILMWIKLSLNIFACPIIVTNYWEHDLAVFYILFSMESTLSCSRWVVPNKIMQLVKVWTYEWDSLPC